MVDVESLKRSKKPLSQAACWTSASSSTLAQSTNQATTAISAHPSKLPPNTRMKMDSCGIEIASSQDHHSLVQGTQEMQIDNMAPPFYQSPFPGQTQDLRAVTDPVVDMMSLMEQLTTTLLYLLFRRRSK